MRQLSDRWRYIHKQTSEVIPNKCNSCACVEQERKKMEELQCLPLLLWSTPVDHHQGEEGCQGLPHSPLDPSTHAPSSCRCGGWHKFCKRQVEDANCENICLDLTWSKGRAVSFVFILFRGHRPIPERDPGITTCDFSSKWSEGRRILPILTDSGGMIWG